jgi:hypothetical protein
VLSKDNVDGLMLSMGAMSKKRYQMLNGRFNVSREKASSILLNVRCVLLDLSKLQKSFAAYELAQLPFVLRQCPEP